MTYLLDTNILSEARRPGGDAGVKRWYSGVSAEEAFLSVLVIGEIRKGIEILRPRDPVQASVYDRWLANLTVIYADRILPVTRLIADEWGRMTAVRFMSTTDALIAATARVHGLTMVTRNVRHFADAGILLLNPFDDE